jgi:hypothetical protein
MSPFRRPPSDIDVPLPSVLLEAGPETNDTPVPKDFQALMSAAPSGPKPSAGPRPPVGASTYTRSLDLNGGGPPRQRLMQPHAAAHAQSLSYGSHRAPPADQMQRLEKAQELQRLDDIAAVEALEYFQGSLSGQPNDPINRWRSGGGTAAVGLAQVCGVESDAGNSGATTTRPNQSQRPMHAGQETGLPRWFVGLGLLPGEIVGLHRGLGADCEADLAFVSVEQVRVDEHPALAWTRWYTIGTRYLRRYSKGRPDRPALRMLQDIQGAMRQ